MYPIQEQKGIVMINNGLVLICSHIIGGSIFLSGGIYSIDTIQVGVIHKLNKFTGHVELCHLVKNIPKCQPLSNMEVLTSIALDTRSALDGDLQTLSMFRKKYPQYGDLSDEELVLALYHKYKVNADSSLSLEEYQMAIGYLPDGFSIEKD